MKHRPDHAPWCALLLAWMLAAASFGWSTLAVGAPTNCSASSATLSLPSSVSVPPNAPTGPLPGATGTAAIIFTCAGLPVTTSRSADYTAQIQAGQYLADLDKHECSGRSGHHLRHQCAGTRVVGNRQSGAGIQPDVFGMRAHQYGGLMCQAKW